MNWGWGAENGEAALLNLEQAGRWVTEEIEGGSMVLACPLPQGRKRPGGKHPCVSPQCH